jgi:hypothetical protein
MRIDLPRRATRQAPLERHRSHRGGWLRAAVLGANDGIVSTASLVLGFPELLTDYVSAAYPLPSVSVAGPLRNGEILYAAKIPQ